jgi:hypothetical protein
VPLPRSLKPEFGYFCQSPHFRRRFGQALAFTILGLMAFVSGAVLLVADHDPQTAFALAPPPNRETAASAPTARTSAAVATVLAEERKEPAVVRGVTDPAATAEFPVDHGGDPALGAPGSAVLVASTPPLKASESTDNAAPSPQLPKTARHQKSHRYSYQASFFWPFDHHYRSGGYGRSRPWKLFW